MKTLLLLLSGFGVSCHPRSETVTVPPRCYALFWSDTANARLFPDSVLLSVGPDSVVVVAGQPPLRSLKPIDSADARWRGIDRAEWWQVGVDTVAIRFSTEQATWAAFVREIGDSLYGTVHYGVATDNLDESPITGVRFACPPGLARAGA